MPEFWPQERWPQTTIPRGTWLRRMVCRIIGHAWGIYWSGGGEPRHEYCLRCWKFRDRY
jgi:hypothetical protein